MRLGNETLSLNFFLLSKLTDILALTSINTLRTFPDVLEHLASQFVPNEIFQIILGSYFGSFEVESTRDLSINLVMAGALALERGVSKSEHIIVSFFRRWCFFSIYIRHNNRAVLVRLYNRLVLDVDDAIVGVINFIPDTVIDFGIVHNYLQLPQSLHDVNDIKVLPQSLLDSVLEE